MTGVAVLAITLTVAAVAGGLLRVRAGRSRAVADGQRVLPAEVGGDFGTRATLLQFSSAFCRPCRATRVVLASVAEMVPGVRHVEVDAESHLDLVRRLDVRRTPTVLLLDAGGVVASRASGQPTREQVLATLGAVLEGAGR